MVEVSQYLQGFRSLKVMATTSSCGVVLWQFPSIRRVCTGMLPRVLLSLFCSASCGNTSIVPFWSSLHSSSCHQRLVPTPRTLRNRQRQYSPGLPHVAALVTLVDRPQARQPYRSSAGCQPSPFASNRFDNSPIPLIVHAAAAFLRAGCTSWCSNSPSGPETVARGSSAGGSRFSRTWRSQHKGSG